MSTEINRIKLIFKCTGICLILFFTDCSLSGEGYTHTTRDIRALVCFSEIHYAGVLYGENGLWTDSDQDFIELKNYSDGVIDISGWVIEVQGNQYCIINIMQGAVLSPGGVYCISSSSDSAFSDTHQVEPCLSLSAAGFSLSLKNGSDSMTADYVDFRGDAILPAGIDLPLLKSSMIRTEDFFGARSSSSPHAWVDYYPFSSKNINQGYQIYASPGVDYGPSDSLGSLL